MQRNRYRNEPETNERRQLLESIEGWKWNVYKEGWQENFEAVREYNQASGKIPTLTTIYNELKIGSWIKKQRDMYRTKRMPDDKKALLESLTGWVWNAMQSWDECLEILRDYVKTYGRFPTKRGEMHQDVNIGQWYITQFDRKREGRIPREQQALLEKIPGWSWTPRKDLWKQRYDILADYVKIYNKLPIHSTVHQGFKIGQ